MGKGFRPFPVSLGFENQGEFDCHTEEPDFKTRLPDFHMRLTFLSFLPKVKSF
ncbi:hypothetical protein PSE_3267 [Pseudovibrio sp. FO-BEG1]|nr:hypothetical protein PSE_3267 [Pseudovibrio sp. FO-BEG1]